MLSNFNNKVKEIDGMMKGFISILTQAQELCHQGYIKSDINILDEARNRIKGYRKIANDIDNEIIRALALYGPEAKDLREMVGYLKITNELFLTAENIASYAKSNKILIMNEFNKDKMPSALDSLHRSAINSLKYLIEMFSRDISEDKTRELYRSIKVEESKADDLNSIIQKELSEIICKSDIEPINYMTMLKLSRKLEHISDHTNNIAKLMLFIKVGGEMELY